MENAIIHAEVLGTNRGKEYYCHCSFGFPPIGLSWWKRGKIHASAAMHHPRTRTGDNFTRKVEHVERGWVQARALAKFAEPWRRSLSVTESVASGSIIPQLGGEAAIMVISSKEPLVFLPWYLCTSPPCVVVGWRDERRRRRRRKLPMTH